ncbi:outer membrane protein assembly factor BamE [Thalassotalea nanhaiensis]|uniref:Outer membrane protein assembly factor BamE n=1 Tax=Thalassotalea nanhaiensis TaxID=3065648 RepID=A0ABY9TGS4_9GAMM|nr:outer membrane protein assembly factor BamE [Colwelliaceae bacterium SQ345]
MLSRAIILSLALCLVSGCVYRIDIPQGNYLEQKQIDKLQVGMTKEQVKYVLGNPVIRDSFNSDTWYYVYEFLSGKDEAFNKRKKLVLSFDGDILTKAEGDFEVGENFHVPMGQ